MPQFDISTYSSQVFWFALCFALLYFFMSKIILPRISKIIAERKAVIDQDSAGAKALQNQISEIKIKTENLKKSANQNYHSQLEEASKNAAKEREKMIGELKIKIDEMNKKSRQELKIFVEKSYDKSKLLIEDLTQKMEQKFFNRPL